MGAWGRKNEDIDPADMVEIEGVITRVMFFSEDTGYSVLRVAADHDSRRADTIVGYAPVPYKVNDRIRASGAWIIDKKWGEQFKAVSILLCMPKTIDGVSAYLASGAIRGIGPKMARILVEAFGDRLFEVIDNEPAKLLQVKGIGEGRYNAIMEGWREQKAVHDIMVFLQGHGISTSKAVRIYKRYGPNAVAVVSRNPFQLARDVKGIGFKSADIIAQNLGIPKDSPYRARAGVLYALEEASAQKGHCCLPRADLVKLANQLLEIPDEIVEEAITHELVEGSLTLADSPCPDSIYLAQLYKREQEIGLGIRGLMDRALPWHVKDPVRAVLEAQDELGITLSNSQMRAVLSALGSKVMVITGGPGVGKTTIVRVILSVLARLNLSISLCAPTGRAAKRLAESSGREASTIHRLLEFDPREGGFKLGEKEPIACDLLIVDECSMVDVSLASALVRAIPKHAAVIFVGDVDQLPSVGPGAFLADMIRSNVVPVIRLTEIHRQAASSWIVRVAHQINSGVIPEFPVGKEVGDCYFVASDQEDMQDVIVNLVTRRIPQFFHVDPIRDIQVLTPMKKSAVGTKVLNTVLQERLNPSPAGAGVGSFGGKFFVGDKVMQIENDYEKGVFNGDIGYVTAIDRESSVLVVDFGDQSVEYPLNDLDGLVLSYACTIHKSQGSEYPVVVIPVTNQHWIMLKRNLFYTAATRGKKLVVLVGEMDALKTAVRDFQTERRKSGLCNRLRGDFRECDRPLLDAGPLAY